MSHRRPRRGARLAVVLVLLLTGAAACGSDDSTDATTTTQSVAERYCAAWEDVVTSFAAYREIDVVEGGTDAIQTYFDDLEAAVSELETVADEQITPSVEAFLTSLEDLGTALTSPDLPVDRRDEVRAASDEVDASWNAMVEALDAGCPDVTAETV